MAAEARAPFKIPERGLLDYDFPPRMPPVETYKRDTPKVGRNEPCPCGSGKKYKKCCMG
ncbi:MAG: SEC-C domain-containing protein [Flavobacteriales bacterium]|nr:SEC-C domain-containing protein [Flavobacteriales bacterium]